MYVLEDFLISRMNVYKKELKDNYYSFIWNIIQARKNLNAHGMRWALLRINLTILETFINLDASDFKNISTKAEIVE